MRRKKNESRRRAQHPSEPPVVTAQTVREQRAAGLLARITTLPLTPPATIVTSAPPPPRASSGFVPSASSTIDRGIPIGATPVTRDTAFVEPSTAATRHSPPADAPTPPPPPPPPVSPGAGKPFDERSPGGPDLEATALRPRHYGLRLPDESVVPVTARAIVVGRRTDQLPPLPPDSDVVALDDPGRSLSRLHVSIVVGAEGGVWVTDLGSGNGTTLVSTTGEISELEPHTPTRVRVGSLLSIGDHAVTVVRRRPEPRTRDEA